MKPKHQRLIFILIGISCLGVATSLILYNFNNNLVFFYSPSQLKEVKISKNSLIRVGGLVKDNTVVKNNSLETEFVITDNLNSIKVYYKGILPNLFREGQGMVAKGYLNSKGGFVAESLLAKHDENYMPPEVAKALKNTKNNESLEQKVDK